MSQTKVSFKSENKLGDCPGVMVGDSKTTNKGLVVIQEWWGLNDQIVEEAALISTSGFVTLTPDLYRGKIATDNEQAGHLMSNLDWPGAVADIKGAIAYLKSVGCVKVGVTGFCMGGALSLATAALSSEVDAAAPFYGIPGKDLCDLKNIKCPVQCHYGNLDTLEGFSAPKDQEKLEQTLKEAGVKLEFHRYEANHAFTNTKGPNYNKDCCDTALKRLCEFMNTNLAASTKM